VVANECLIRRINLNNYLDFTLLHQLNKERYPYLLESVAHGTAQGRFDIAFAFPEKSLKLDYSGSLAVSDGGDIAGGDFLKQLDLMWQEEKVVTASPSSFLPFTGGWFIFLSYELVSQIERKLIDIPVDNDLPIAQATRIPAAIIRDNNNGELFLVAERNREALIEMMMSDLQQLSGSSAQLKPIIKSLEEDEGDVFCSGVKRCRDYLYEGDVFQVNLSREYRGKLKSEKQYLDLYRNLKESNPAPFAGLATFADSAICSSSPERLVRVQNNHVDMRPIAGTRPRNSNDLIDKQLSSELLSSSKEQAEHVMLIDLIRNDLGRICEYDSIRVEEDRVLESYAHVHHIVSNVGGNLVDGTPPGEVIRALFPGGTITGCPKVRCMEIIAELESVPRGAYTGSMGYLNLNGDMDLNILIRTIVCENERFHFRTGAGIVSDSVAEHELKETKHKAKGLLRALSRQ
jgi:anthranilate synthase component 1